MRCIIRSVSIEAEFEVKHGHLAALADDVLRHVGQMAPDGSVMAVWVVVP